MRPLPAALVALALACAAAGGAAAADPTQTHPPTPPPAAPAARIVLEFDPARFRVGAEGIRTWVARSADIVARYYGAFPAALVTVRILAVDGSGVRGGRAYAAPGPGIELRLGEGSEPATLAADWVLVHEMIHLALPELGESHAWLAEGLATYVEGVARVAAGNLEPADFWLEKLGSMPTGLPAAGDRGLDHTPSWGRTYWGGALYCLSADVAIREATANRASLGTALRAILAASGGMQVRWPIERVLSVGDAATGTTVLMQLYREHRDRAVVTDLAALWARLGVSAPGGVVQLAEAAPLAAIRTALTRDAAPGPRPAAAKIVAAR